VTRPLVVLIAILALWLLLLMACQRPPHSTRLGRAILAPWRAGRPKRTRKTPAARSPLSCGRRDGAAPAPETGAVLLIPDYECYLGPYPVTVVPRLRRGEIPASYWRESAEKLATGELLKLARHADQRDGVDMLPPVPRLRMTPLAARHFAHVDAGTPCGCRGQL
jgi:hypothetical protein